MLPISIQYTDTRCNYTYFWILLLEWIKLYNQMGLKNYLDFMRMKNELFHIWFFFLLFVGKKPHFYFLFIVCLDIENRNVQSNDNPKTKRKVKHKYQYHHHHINQTSSQITIVTYRFFFIFFFIFRKSNFHNSIIVSFRLKHYYSNIKLLHIISWRHFFFVLLIWN